MPGPLTFGRPRRCRRGAVLTLVFGTVLATGAAAGTWERPERVDGPAGAAPVADGDIDTARLASAIAEGKVGPQAAQELVSRSGDRWSSFYTAQEYAGLQQALDGRYVGVGLWVRRTEGGRITVARVQSGSPAQRAGLELGDQLRTVDGASTDGSPVTEVVSELRGAAANSGGAGAGAGTRVRLGLQRGTRDWKVTLRREVLATEAVTVRHPGTGVTEVKVVAFTKDVGRQVREAVRGRHGGVLLDLRGNSGGLVTEAVGVASSFLDGGLVATYDVHGRQKVLNADEGGDTTTPLVVLVDGGTMSAAELLAGALQDRGRAVIVGSRTFGKGSVQMPSRLPDGSVAELTVGHYSLPDGRGVDDRGITPDLLVAGGVDAEAQAYTVLSGLSTPT